MGIGRRSRELAREFWARELIFSYRCRLKSGCAYVGDLTHGNAHLDEGFGQGRAPLNGNNRGSFQFDRTEESW